MSHQVDPGLKALGFQPVESTSLSKVLVSDVNLHPYNARAQANRAHAFVRVTVIREPDGAIARWGGASLTLA